jgi:hypothetical protein
MFRLIAMFTDEVIAARDRSMKAGRALGWMRNGGGTTGQWSN